jgi:oligosaccharide reducing-end xylanase
VRSVPVASLLRACVVLAGLQLGCGESAKAVADGNSGGSGSTFGGGAASSGSSGSDGSAGNGMTSQSGTATAGHASSGSGGSSASSSAAGAGGKDASTEASASAGSGDASTATIPGNGCTPPAAYDNLFASMLGHTQSETDDKLNAAWAQLLTAGGSGAIYFDGPGANESYIEDNNAKDVRTEGMGYGMMAAVQLDHQATFDRLWAWVKNHMVESNAIAWSCSPSGSKNSTGGAPDGDLYLAAALIFAHNRWGDTSGVYNYKTEADSTLNILRTQDFNKTYNLIQYYSGSDNGQTDPSYILPAFNQVFACYDTANATFWNATVTASRDFFHKAMNSSGQFGDQMSYTGGSGTSSGFDAQRCVMNIMMDWNFFAADPWQRDTYATTFSAHAGAAGGGGATAFMNTLLAFALPASSGKAYVQDLWSASVPSKDYWNGTLYLLSMLHVSGTFQLWY